MAVDDATLRAFAAACKPGDQLHFDVDVGELANASTPTTVDGAFQYFDTTFAAWQVQLDDGRKILVMNDWITSVVQRDEYVHGHGRRHP